ncbi:Trehalase [Gracilariopsis chorda]|uniref:Trehalase n=1 Tax=Gracilariopsis chorda TaxID=448386 RepID=A0A2V3J4M9_9FLOR|nr:Trehalase [Gracilariopsis chorda]|eukprot:PXF49334.1 Trehalase [Gracilariopsis chorda]
MCEKRHVSSSPSPLMLPSRRDSLFPAASVFCHPQLLSFVQNSPYRPFTDSKTFVDMQLTTHPHEVLARFAELPSQPTPEQYDQFLRWAFKQPDTQLVQHHTPLDYTDSLPSFVSQLQLPNRYVLDEFVMDIKKRWRMLARSFSHHNITEQHSLTSTLIPLPHPFFIPGGRFQECYYWDTLWIAKGLIVCDMLQSAKDAIRNLFHLVNTLGFVPNGNRVYYLNRSQPPVLTEAVLVIFRALGSTDERIEWLEEALPVLERELASFEAAHALSRVHPETSIAHQRLDVYNVVTDHARPESFKEDTATVDEMIARAPHLSTDYHSQIDLLRHLAAGAESGWDYSSRWFCNSDECLAETQATNVVPCCLNSILYKAESDMAAFHMTLAEYYKLSSQTSSGHPVTSDAIRMHIDKSKLYETRAAKRKHAIISVLWDSDQLFGFDYDVKEARNTGVLSIAGIMPVWAGCVDDSWTVEHAKQFVHKIMNVSGLLHDGGVACTSTVSKEQWDFPNCWPPLVDFAVETLRKLAVRFPESDADRAAEEIAARFLRSAYRGWQSENVFHEKYDCRYETGKRGEGGEYRPQTGFGWTNGTIMWLLKDYPHCLS